MKMAGKNQTQSIFHPIKEFTCKQLRASFKKIEIVFIQQSTIDQMLSVC